MMLLLFQAQFTLFGWIFSRLHAACALVKVVESQHFWEDVCGGGWGGATAYVSCYITWH
jgi:hypothetical protein